MMEIAGQIFGWLTTLCSAVSYQLKTKKQLLIAQTLATAFMALSYLLLGAYSGMLLNVVCLIRNLIYSSNKKFCSYRWWPYVLAGVSVLCGIFTWQGPMSLFAIVGLAVNTVAMSTPNLQRFRRSILFTSTLVLIYDIYFAVWGGVMNEVLALVSASVGLYRFRNKEEKVNQTEAG